MMRMMLKMAAVALLLLCCIVIASTDSQDGCDSYAVEGQNFAVPLDYKLQGSEILKWKHEDSVIFHQRKEQLFIGSKDDVYTNGSLKLTNLKKINKGRYTPEVHHKDGKSAGNFKTTHLCIFDSVPKPGVTIECPATYVKFSCTVGKVQGLTLVWLKNKAVMKETTKTLKLKAKDVENDSFQCRVSNPAMSMTSDTVKQKCTKPKLFGLDFWIMVAILASGGGLVLVLIIIVIVCCIRARRKKSMKVKDEEELRLGWTNPEHHHHHHDQHNHPPGYLHPHHHQKQPAGHTGPRQHRSKQHRDPRSKVPDLPNSQPQPSPRRAAQTPRPVDNADDEQPPPLPQPRKKAPKTPRV